MDSKENEEKFKSTKNGINLSAIANGPESSRKGEGGSSETLCTFNVDGSRNFRRKKIRCTKINCTEFSPYTTGTNSIYGNMTDYINLVQTAIGASNRTNSTGEYRLFGAGIVCDLSKKYDLPLSTSV